MIGLTDQVEVAIIPKNERREIAFFDVFTHLGRFNVSIKQAIQMVKAVSLDNELFLPQQVLLAPKVSRKMQQFLNRTAHPPQLFKLNRTILNIEKYKAENEMLYSAAQALREGLSNTEEQWPQHFFLSLGIDMRMRRIDIPKLNSPIGRRMVNYGMIEITAIFKEIFVYKEMADAISTLPLPNTAIIELELLFLLFVGLDFFVFIRCIIRAANTELIAPLTEHFLEELKTKNHFKTSDQRLRKIEKWIRGLFSLLESSFCIGMLNDILYRINFNEATLLTSVRALTRRKKTRVNVLIQDGVTLPFRVDPVTLNKCSRQLELLLIHYNIVDLKSQAAKCPDSNRVARGNSSQRCDMLIANLIATSGPCFMSIER